MFVKETGQCAESFPSPHYGVRRLDDRRDYLGANLESMKLTDTIARSADRKCQFFPLFFFLGGLGSKGGKGGQGGQDGQGGQGWARGQVGQGGKGGQP